MNQCNDRFALRPPNPPAKLREMREPRTPSELAARRKSNMPQKIFKKSLSYVFEDTRISKESADSSPINKVVDEESADSSPITEVVGENENDFGASCLPNLASSPYSDASILFDISHSSVITTENNELDNVSVSCNGLNTLEGIMTGSVESEIAVNFLKKARFQVLNSVSVNRQSKKLVEFLIETTVANLLNDYKERDQTTELVHAKIVIVLLFLFFWILALVLYFRNLGGTSSFNGPLPT